MHSHARRTTHTVPSPPCILPRRPCELSCFDEPQVLHSCFTAAAPTMAPASLHSPNTSTIVHPSSQGAASIVVQQVLKQSAPCSAESSTGHQSPRCCTFTHKQTRMDGVMRLQICVETAGCKGAIARPVELILHRTPKPQGAAHPRRNKHMPWIYAYRVAAPYNSTCCIFPCLFQPVYLHLLHMPWMSTSTTGKSCTPAWKQTGGKRPKQGPRVGRLQSRMCHRCVSSTTTCPHIPPSGLHLLTRTGAHQSPTYTCTPVSPSGRQKGAQSTIHPSWGASLSISGAY